MSWPGARRFGYRGLVVNGRTLHALVPRWALRWCAPALLLLIVLVAQPAECPVGHHQMDAAASVVTTSLVAFTDAPVASAAVPDVEHGPICHEPSAGDLPWTQGHPARTTVVKTAPGPSSVATSSAAAQVSGSSALPRSTATAPSGRAILLAIGIARG